MTDKELVKKLMTDPQAGLAAVIDRYTAYVLKIAHIKLNGVCSSEDIEVAVSDVFFIFYKSGQQCGFEIRLVRAYLSLIAARHFTDVFRRQVNKAESIPLDDIADRLACDDRQQNSELAEAVQKLGEPDTSIFIRKVRKEYAAKNAAAPESAAA